MAKSKRATSPPADLAAQKKLAQSVLDAEAQAIRGMRIDDSFHAAVQLILEHTGDAKRQTASNAVVVSGVGKSGIVGRKISATLASTGTPSHFLHPVEAMHGDLGRVRGKDVVLLLSYSGATDEVVALAGVLRQDRVAVISILGKLESDLARLSTVSLSIGEVEEACPMNLAPTASTTAMLALGDALALCVSQRRSFNEDDFRRVHPAGGVGRLLTPVSAAMRFKVGTNLPLFSASMTVEEAFAKAEPTDKILRRAGALLVVNRSGKLAGIFTDGDLRRWLIRLGRDAMKQPLEKVMTANPRRLSDTSLLKDAVKLMREFRINEIPVVNAANKPVGLLDVQDLVAMKVVDG